MHTSPEDLRARGHGCLCVCRPQETDRLLLQMGSRWRQVAYVVEDAAILSRELEATTSTRVRAASVDAALARWRRERGGAGGGPSARAAGGEREEAARQAEVVAMVGQPVARYALKHELGLKMAGKERWSSADKEFELYSGLDESDMGYASEAQHRSRRDADRADRAAGGGGGGGVSSRSSHTTDGASLAPSTVRHKNPFGVL